MKKYNRFFQVMMATLLLMASCKTPTAYFNQGDYDASVVEAIEKLAKKKKNKRKHVLIVEEAFRKVTRQDMAEVKSLQAEGRASNWVKINKIHNQIKDRQELIEPFLPLYAKDGYKAEFQFVKINPLEQDSRKKAAEYYYATAKDYLQKGEAGHKYSARRAYANFGKINKYFDNYKDVDALRARAYDIGQNHILFTAENATDRVLPRDFEEQLLGFNVKKLNTTWTKYYSNTEAYSNFDYAFTMRLRDIRISPERVQERRYMDQKEIQDGFDYVLDSNGNVLKDTLGNDVKTPRYVFIQAWVDEVHQSKEATLYGRLILRDLATNEIVRNENIQVTNVFENYAATFQGDRRALSPDSCRRIGNSPLPFPTDEMMLFDALDNLHPAIRTGIDNCRDVASL